MNRITQLQRLFCGLAGAVTLSACVTAPPVKDVPPPVPPLDKTMAQAAQASEAGQKEQALKLLQQAATNYPTDKTPWEQMAQIKFDGGQYGDAIHDAQQALTRDPTDTKANSIIAISGLRLATTALGDLIRQNNLDKNVVRNESQDLAKLLRDNVGANDLFPNTKRSPTGIRPPAPRARTGAPAATTPAKPADDAADPFGALK
jgi:tetratricopeptide (TPR) repeat protein